MTPPESPPTAEPTHPPTLEAVLVASWQSFADGTAPPPGLIAHIAAAVKTHLRQILDPAREQASATARREAYATQTLLDRLSRRIREQLAGAVTEEHLDVELANAILESCALPALARMWQVRIGLPFVLEVSAACQEEAFEAAEDAISKALGTDHGIEIEWDGRQHDQATPADLDPNEL